MPDEKPFSRPEHPLGRPEVLAASDLAGAVQMMRDLGVHPGGVEIMAPKAVFRLVLVRAVDPRAANIVKQEFLARGGDAALPFSVAAFTHEPVDMLLMGTLHQYGDLIEKLHRSPYFRLPALAAALAEALAASAPGWTPPPPPRPPGREE